MWRNEIHITDATKWYKNRMELYYKFKAERNDTNKDKTEHKQNLTKGNTGKEKLKKMTHK